MNKHVDITDEVGQIVEAFANLLGGTTPTFSIKNRPDGDFIVFEMAEPSPQHFELLNAVNEEIGSGNGFKDRIGLIKRRVKPSEVLDLPETVMLQKELSKSLTVDKDTFGEEFLARYTESVTELEKQIVVEANHAVYGRRGSGKSSLLAFAMHQLRKRQQPYAWVAMQAYAGRDEPQAIAGVLSEILAEAGSSLSTLDSGFQELSEELLILGETDDSENVRTRLKRLVPRIRKMFKDALPKNKIFTIFLDDLHVVGKELQPELLGSIYAITRQNRCYIKISGIEQLTNLWNAVLKQGVEPGNDIQTLKLDHNLTAPDQSKSHIESILDRHAKFCGFPGIRYLTNDDFLDRLVLSAAAVPRDALTLFSKSIGRSLLKKQKTVSVLSLNAAASEAIEEKLKDIQKDLGSGEQAEIAEMLARVKKFCISKNKTNAFLVEIANSSVEYASVQNLVALRFIHVLHEGITPHKAGVRFVALMLDYGFYIGIRAAKSVTLFPEKPRVLLAKELRKLPILSL